MKKLMLSSENLLRPVPGLLSFLFSLVLGSTAVFGQGTVKGVITDKADNMPLIAANILVKGTTTGTVADYNGAYILPLKAGTYTLHISYMGYETREETVTVEDGQTVELNVQLGATSIMGEEVIVTTQARGQLAAVNQQIRSNQIINVVSAERIRELPDENAAQAISRLPGIHLDGNQVVIRGLQPKMNKIMVNGVELPSTEQETRATDLGMVSANMLSGIEVYKTLTPDMDADAIGGVVNLRFREAAPGLHYSLTTQGSYNQQEKYMGRYTVWGDVSNRFLDNKLGVILNLNYEKRQYGFDWYSNVYWNIANSTEFWDGDYVRSGIDVYDEINKRDNIGGSLVIDYALPKGKIIYSGMLTHTATDETEYRDDMGWAGQRQDYHQLHLTRANFTRLLLNNDLRYEQQLGIVSIDASIGNVMLDHKDAFRYHYRFSQEWIQNFISDSIRNPKLKIQGPWAFYGWINPAVWNEFRTEDCQYNPRTFDEKHWLGDFNVKVPLRITENINIDFKLGGKYKRIDRNYDEVGLQYYQDDQAVVNQSMADWLTNRIGHEPVESILRFEDWRDYNYKPNKGYMNGEGARMDYVISKELMDEMWTQVLDVNPETTPIFSVPNQARNDYWGYETHTAAYLMGEINLGKRVTVIPGVRVEKVHNHYSAPKVEYRSMTYWFVLDTMTKPADHVNWLPHLHLRFRATDWWDIRFSYNNTLTRPDYTYAVPSIFYNLATPDAEAGNPYIRPATSENFDANFTFYSRKMGLFTIGGFYKRLNDVFYRQPTILKNIPDTTIVAEFPLAQYSSLRNFTTDFYLNSPYTAYVKGLEVEWQSNFSWLPSPFNGLVLNANYTHVWSETEYNLHRVLYIVPPGGFLPVATEADTSYTNRLLDQADDIANVSMGYDFKGLSARLSFRYQGNVVSSIASLPQLNEYTDKVYKFDFVIKQRIPIKYGDLEVFLNAINFTNVPYGRFVDYPVQSGGETVIKRQTTYKRYTGRQFQLGLRFRY
jgi:TonB-dependent receptor